MLCAILRIVEEVKKMIVYSEDEKAKDFNFFKKINKEYFEKNGHKFLAIKKESVIDAADEIPELISKMNEKMYEIGSYLIQECTGNDSAFKTVVMKLLLKGADND